MVNTYNIFPGYLLETKMWSEEPSTRLVYLTMLVLMNRWGRVEISEVEVIASHANLPLETCRAAIARLECDLGDGGSYLARIDGGWEIRGGERMQERALRSLKLVRAIEKSLVTRERRRASSAIATL